MSKLHLPYLLFLNILFLISWIVLWPQHPYLLIGVLTTIGTLVITAIKRYHEQQSLALKSLEAGLLSMHDGDFSISLPAPDTPIARNIVSLFNKVSDKLRQERQYIYQRELLLDKVVNASSTLTILINVRDEIVFTNQAAQHYFFPCSAEISTTSWPDVLNNKSPELAQLVQNSSGTFITLPDENNQPQSWHLSCSELKMHGETHRLYLFKPMTEELNRQELQTWKKVVRVINHELNNSIAPISSMCHSGKLLAKNLNEPRLDKVFSTISRRVAHLSEFIKDYSRLARINAPEKKSVQIDALISGIESLFQFQLKTESDLPPIEADEHQLEQVFINIIKNAYEAAPGSTITVAVRPRTDGMLQVSVLDKGPGIAPELIPQALLPGFSTKNSGSGIGLALCREIIESHGGQLYLNNRPEGGLEVSVLLPLDEC